MIYGNEGGRLRFTVMKAVGFGVGYCLRVLVDDQGKEALIIVDDKLSNNY